MAKKTAKDVARDGGCSYQLIYGVETNGGKITLTVLNAYSKALDIPIGGLFFLVDNRDSPEMLRWSKRWLGDRAVGWMEILLKKRLARWGSE